MVVALSLFVLLLLDLPMTLSLAVSKQHRIEYRQGCAKDEGYIAWKLACELMNPLGVVGERFVVATASRIGTEDDGIEQIVGCTQVRPIGTSLRDPSTYNARPGSYDAGKGADDAAWEEFEADEGARVPVGWQSLPWTKEYRAFATAAKDRRQRSSAKAKGRVESLVQDELLYELASVWVDPAFRGRGIGTELVKRVLQQNSRIRPEFIYLLTLASTSRWYRENFGFVLAKDVPKQMDFEVTAGNLITRLIGTQLVCMQGRPR
jgi:N-acetylglutamate synthase-like GNAT family acetyltransferase